MAQTPILRLAHLFITLVIVFISQCCTSYLSTQYSYLSTNKSSILTMYVKNMPSFVSKELVAKTTSLNGGLRQEPHTNLHNPARIQLETHQQGPHKTEYRHRNGQPPSKLITPQPKVRSITFRKKILTPL